ncbi:MAG: nicotinate-nucleotide adenylyltransferase [Pseudomonadota bacterium]
MIRAGPVAMPGQRVGLLGGSFDPPHAGHVHISEWALRAAGLDWLWWLVSPGNPLKPREPVDLERRLAASRQIRTHPRIVVTDIERHLPTAFTANTLMHLAERYPGVRFIWVMGADNLVTFHHWERWRWIFETWPLLVLARPGQQLSAGLSPAARSYAHLRRPASAASVLGRNGEPGWCLLTGPMSAHSSTAIRGQGGWS